MYESHNPDVLSCLASLSNDEVFTPPSVANQMLDLLPKEIWKNPDAKFLDPCCKSGIFLREIVKRLLVGLEDQYPVLQDRINHILHDQVYGIAITELTSFLSRRSLYCSKHANGEYSICDNFRTDDGNVAYSPIKHKWLFNKCEYCGANRGTYDRSEDLESHAYQFIHIVKPEEIFKMQFDVIIGNPPYQISDGGQKASAIPLYHKFVQQAKKLNPRFLTMIIPARWYSGGRGLDKFRDEMINDTHIRKLVDYTDSNDCFPGVDIAGGICYFLWDRDHEGPCDITNKFGADSFMTTRNLNFEGVFIRYGQALPIIEKIREKRYSCYDSRVSSQKPFGLRTYVTPTGDGDIKLRYSGGIGNFRREEVTAGKEWIDKWKVTTSYLTYDHAGRPDKDGKRRIFSTMDILPPSTVCTETYIVIDVFDTEKEAVNLYNYLQTKFVRFLVSQLTSTQHLSKSNFALVPIMDFKRSWSDTDLYALFNLSTDEIGFINSMIRDMGVSVSNES